MMGFRILRFLALELQGEMRRRVQDSAFRMYKGSTAIGCDRNHTGLKGGFCDLGFEFQALDTSVAFGA